MILLGGQGTRLRPFTITTPKSFLPIANIPMIHYQLVLLAKYKIDNVVLAVSPHCQKHREFFSIAKSLGINLHLSCERKPLGTAGGIRNAYKFLKGNEPFFVFNGDIISDCDLDKMLECHKVSGADVSIAVVEVENPRDFGVIIVDGEKRISQFIEKPQNPVSNLINAGIYIIHPEILDEMPADREVSIEREVFPALIERGKKLFAYVHKGYWKDVGTIQNYRSANFDIVEGRVNVYFSGLSNEIPASKSVQVNGKLKLGEKVILGNNVITSGTVVIGDGCYVGDNTILKDAIIFRNVLVGKNCIIENSIIGNSTFIEDNCEIRDSAVADGCRFCQYTKIRNSGNPERL